MPPKLFGVLEKRNWANHHFELIETSIRNYIESNPYSVTCERDEERGIYHARLVYPNRPKLRHLSLMIGDCIHNMRSTLDYIAWELAGHDFWDRDTMFPICASAEEFKRIRNKRIGRLPPETQTAIERLQPYNTLSNGRSAINDINNLDILDKHKALAVVISVAEHVIADPWLPPHIDTSKCKVGLKVFPQVFKHDAIIATFTVTPPVPNVEVEFKITPQIEFGYIPCRPKHSFVAPHLQWMLDYIDNAIDQFRPFFDSTEKG